MRSSLPLAPAGWGRCTGPGIRGWTALWRWKVLPAELAANPEQRHRLEREARAVSALNHPHTQGKLKKVDVTTGRVETLCDASSLVGGSWSGEDVILFVPNGISPVYRVAASGGVASPVTALDRSRATVGHAWPQFLPDGRQFLYSVLSGKEEYSGTYVGSLDRPAESQDARPLVSAMAALYAPPGYLLFPRDSDLHAWPFDLARLRVTGEPRLLAARAGGVTFNRIPRPMWP